MDGRRVTRNGTKQIAAKAVQEFPHLLPGEYKSAHAKATAWWRNKDTYLNLRLGKQRPGNISTSARDGTRRVNFKVVAGRGRRRATWVAALYPALLSEFERLRAASVKLSPAVLRCVAKSLISGAPLGSPFHKDVNVDGKLLEDKVTIRWVQTFMSSHNIVVRRQAGKLATSPEKQTFIEKSVAHHLGELKRGFESGALKEEMIENADETHFIFNMDNGRTIGFRGDEEIKYADLVSGDEGITMMVRLTGGRDARIQPPMLIFKNDNCSYPIRGVIDNVPGVCYRSGKKGWMDKRVFKEWLSEPRAISKPLNGRRRTLFVDNCSGHNENDDTALLLSRINTNLKKFPANATDLVQPADSFVISKIKDAWRRRWDAYKVGLIERGEWMRSESGSSGKLKNPGKQFFLKLAADSVRDVNAQKDKEGLSYARKAMIRTGMSLNLNGNWEERQLFTNLQGIIAKHRNHFNGEPVE